MKFLKIKSSTTKADLKQQYRLAAQKYHPDKGGNHDDFLKLQEEYEKAIAKISAPQKKKRKFKKYSDEELDWMLKEFEKLHRLYNKKQKKK